MTCESIRTTSRMQRMIRRLLELGKGDPLSGTTDSPEDRKERLRAAIIASGVADVEAAGGISFAKAFHATYQEPLRETA